MIILLIITIFVLGFLTLYAAYKYGGRYPLGQYIVYVIIILIFLVVICDLAGLLPANYLNRRI